MNGVQIMKTLLVSPPYCTPGEDIGSRDVDYAGSNPPLGILSIATMMRQHGFQVEVLDLFKYTSWKEIRDTIYDCQFDIFGISIWTGNHFKARKILDIVKEKNPHLITVAGGPHATVLDEQIVRHFQADYVVRGEGEYTILELLDALKDDRDVGAIPGLTYLQKNQVFRTADRSPIEDLNALPFTDFSGIDLDSYTQNLWSDIIIPEKLRRQYHIDLVKFAPIITSRGCPGRCNFCFRMFDKIRLRSSKNVLEEIKSLYDRHGIAHIRFSDDTLNINEKRLQEICEGIISEKIDITWDTSIRAFPLSHKTVDLMKASGCVKLSVGVETGSPRLMKAMKKGVSAEKVIHAFNICHDVGIPIVANIIVGLPGETAETIKETFEFMKIIKPDYTLVSVLLLYPMTEAYFYARDMGFIDDDYFLKSEVVPVYTHEHSFEQLLDYNRRIYTFNFIQAGDHKKMLYYMLLRLRDRIGHFTHVYPNTRGFDVKFSNRKYIFDYKRGVSKVDTVTTLRHR